MTRSRRTTTYLESTDVPASRSAEEIRNSLVAAGARQIATEYGDGGQITGLSWSMRVERVDVQFKLPARVAPVYNLLKQAETGKTRPTEQARLQAKAERIAWRQLYAWTKIQLAMIQTGMTCAQEVFMPYAVERDGAGRTMFEVWSSQLALPAPKKESE